MPSSPNAVRTQRSGQPTAQPSASAAQAMLAAAAIALMAGCATSEADLQAKGLKPVTEAELRALFAERREGSFDGPQNSGLIEWKPDGTVSFGIPRGGFSDSGRYRIDGDTYCARMNKIRNGEEGCFRFYRTGDRTFTSVGTDGRFNANLTLR